MSLLFFTTNTKLLAQKADTLTKPNNGIDTLKISEKSPKNTFPNPKKAAMWAIIPGGGQIYNRKLWYVKLPIVYAAIGGVGYQTYLNQTQYKRYKTAYYNSVNSLPLPSGVSATASSASLLRARDILNKRRQQFYFFTGAVYLLSVAEAFTAAHLAHFDIDESLSIKPSFETTPLSNVAGMKLSFSF